MRLVRRVGHALPVALWGMAGLLVVITAGVALAVNPYQGCPDSAWSSGVHYHLGNDNDQTNCIGDDHSDNHYEVFRLYKGNDTAHARGSNPTDEIHGGEGNDTLSGEAGHDEIWGEDGQDYMYGDLGDDDLHGVGGQPADNFFGGDGGDHLYGGDGPDILKGESGQDTILDNPPGYYNTYEKDIACGGDGGDNVDIQDGDAEDLAYDIYGTDNIVMDTNVGPPGGGGGETDGVNSAGPCPY